jgi:CBS domain-containing protein
MDSKIGETARVAIVARDVMTAPVIAASSSESVAGAAKMMLDNHLGALPVVDASGALVGMVSDGDLIGRRPEDRRRDWWLTLMSQGSSSLDLPRQSLTRPVSEVMSAPVLTVSPSTTLDVVAEMLQVHKIKRLPVLEQGELVGVVSRTDLVALSANALKPAPASAGASLIEFLESMIGGASLLSAMPRKVARSAGPAQAAAPAPEDFSATALRARADAFGSETRDHREADRIASRRERQRAVKTLLDQHVSRELWRSMIEHARIAADHGETTLLMLRFPCELCSDGGRKIDVAEQGWETTLRGEAAEFYARWRDELKPLGFHLSARIDSYIEGGVIGDVGLYLAWGK